MRSSGMYGWALGFCWNGQFYTSFDGFFIVLVLSIFIAVRGGSDETLSVQ